MPARRAAPREPREYFVAALRKSLSLSVQKYARVFQGTSGTVDCKLRRLVKYTLATRNGIELIARVASESFNLLLFYFCRYYYRPYRPHYLPFHLSLSPSETLYLICLCGGRICEFEIILGKKHATGYKKRRNVSRSLGDRLISIVIKVR